MILRVFKTIVKFLTNISLESGIKLLKKALIQ
jgi:hypothetical protein